MSHWKIADVMTSEVFWVPRSASYRQIVDLLAAHHIGAVPVLDTGHRVVGVVSETDLLYKVEFTGWPERPRLFEGRSGRIARHKAEAATADDLMSTPPITTGPDTPVSRAAKLMDIHQVKHLPVENELGRLIGIASRSDLLTVFLQPDAGIRDEILDQVLRDVLHTGPPAVEVTVTDGVVELSGTLPRRSLVPLAIRLTYGVDGVVEVHDHLSFEVDDLDTGALISP
jgi:CBS domain-containing protein